MNHPTLEELALLWEVTAETEQDSKPGRRETMRECADTLRMLVSSLPTAQPVMGLATAHILNLMQRDGRLAYLIGPGSQAYELLTGEAAKAATLDPSAYRATFESTLKFEPWPTSERADIAREGSPIAFQDRVGEWTVECFGEAVSKNTKERTNRFLEEALELAQACDCTEYEAHQLVDYVFNRSAGEKEQEVGGVMMTLSALCNAQAINLGDSAEAELARVWKAIDAIRSKQAQKPAFGPMAGRVPREARLTDFPDDQVRISFFLHDHDFDRFVNTGGEAIHCMGHLQFAVEALFLAGLERKEDELRDQFQLFGDDSAKGDAGC